MSDAPPDEGSDDLYENAPCGLLSLEADGTVRRANAAFARWTGVAAQDLMGCRIRDLLTLPGRIVYETSLVPMLRLQGGFEEVMLDFTTASGAEMPAFVNAAARVGPDGEVANIRLAVFRFPERRTYEQGLKARERTAMQGLSDEREAARLREEFIAVLGHDLRNPLASILAAAQLLRRETLSPKALHVIRLMEVSVDRMARLVDDVVDFARGRLGGGIALTRQLLQIEPVLRHVVAELEASHPGRSMHLEAGSAEPVWFDPGRLSQLVSNLLGNALTHGDPASPIHVRATVADGQLELWVANAGEPIPEAALPHLFQPFFRAKLRPSKQGLGLGLHIASEIAKAHGGSLGVSSDSAETRFTLRMPVDGVPPVQGDHGARD